MEAGWHSPVVASDALAEARVKRLTLDIPADFHRALKIRAAALAVLMVELLRVLIEQALEDPSTLANLVEVQR